MKKHGWVLLTVFCIVGVTETGRAQAAGANAQRAIDCLIVTPFSEPAMGGPKFNHILRVRNRCAAKVEITAWYRDQNDHPVAMIVEAGGVERVVLGNFKPLSAFRYSFRAEYVR